VTRLRSNSNPPTIEPWREDEAMRRIIERASRYSLVTPERMFMLLQWLDFALTSEGEVAEFGVWRGGTASLMHAHLASKGCQRTLHLFDSFAGLPDADPVRDNHHRKGDLSDASESAVRVLFADAAGVAIHVGCFEETVGTVSAERFCFAHIDADLYRSVRFATEFVFPRLSAGGVIVYDDYGFRTCAGAKAAVDEYFAATSVRPVYLTTGQCVAIKLQPRIEVQSRDSLVA